jgi:hypothetical protein
MDGNSTGHIDRTPSCKRAKTATAERYAACVAVATMLEAAAARENESQREAVGREAKTRSELKTLECQLKQAELAADRGHRHLAFVRQCLDSVNDEKNRCVADVKRGEVSLQAAEVACTFAIETEGTAARAQMVATKAAAVARTAAAGGEETALELGAKAPEVQSQVATAAARMIEAQRTLTTWTAPSHSTASTTATAPLSSHSGSNSAGVPLVQVHWTSEDLKLLASSVTFTDTNLVSLFSGRNIEEIRQQINLTERDRNSSSGSVTDGTDTDDTD